MGGAVIGQGCLLIAVALFGSNLPAFMVSQFPVRNRYSGIGIGKFELMMFLATYQISKCFLSFYCVAYNLAHAMFSGTAPIVQTALVMSSPYIAAQSSNGHQSIHPHLSPYYIRHDGRLRPAYYMISVSIISFMALTFGVPYCERKRIEKEEILSTEAAIESAFDVEIIPSSETPINTLSRENSEVGFDTSDASYDRRIFTV